MSASSDSIIAEDSAQPVFTISRTFDAPRELVFKAWSEPERLAKWWGPKGCAIRVEALDFRLGGKFHYAMGLPDGNEMWGLFVYGDIDAPESMVFVNSFSNPAGEIVRAPFSADWPLEVRNLLTLTDEGGKTNLTLAGSPINANEKELAMFAGFFSSMEQGFGGTFEQLDEYLAGAQSAELEASK